MKYGVVLAIIRIILVKEWGICSKPALRHRIIDLLRLRVDVTGVSSDQQTGKTLPLVVASGGYLGKAEVAVATVTNIFFRVVGIVYASVGVGQAQLALSFIITVKVIIIAPND